MLCNIIKRLSKMSKEKQEFSSRLVGKLPKKLFDKPIIAELYFYEKYLRKNTKKYIIHF